jgi:hypothetical protein
MTSVPPSPSTPIAIKPACLDIVNSIPSTLPTPDQRVLSIVHEKLSDNKENESIGIADEVLVSDSRSEGGGDATAISNDLVSSPDHQTLRIDLQKRFLEVCCLFVSCHFSQISD